MASLKSFQAADSREMDSTRPTLPCERLAGIPSALGRKGAGTAFGWLSSLPTGGPNLAWTDRGGVSDRCQGLGPRLARYLLERNERHIMCHPESVGAAWEPWVLPSLPLAGGAW